MKNGKKVKIIKYLCFAAFLVLAVIWCRFNLRIETVTQHQERLRSSQEADSNAVIYVEETDNLADSVTKAVVNADLSVAGSDSIDESELNKSDTNSLSMSDNSTSTDKTENADNASDTAATGNSGNIAVMDNSNIISNRDVTDDGSAGNGDVTLDSNDSTDKTDTADTVEYYSVRFLITCNAVLNNISLNTKAVIPEDGIIFSSELKVKKGLTVLDLLLNVSEEKGILVINKGSSETAYISSINGLAEKECGAMSGWKYKVNGTAPMSACNKIYVNDGDVIEWYYAVSPND